MKILKCVHPSFPNVKPFNFAVDLATIDSVIDNGSEFDITMNNGEKHRIVREDTFLKLIEQIDEEKEKRYVLHRSL